MKYYVIFEEYTEYTQFEGSWDVAYEEFDNPDEAARFAEEVECVKYGRFCSGVLRTVKDPSLENVDGDGI